jgi:hypothetical protein
MKLFGLLMIAVPLLAKPKLGLSMDIGGRGWDWDWSNVNKNNYGVSTCSIIQFAFGWAGPFFV